MPASRTRTRARPDTDTPPRKRLHIPPELTDMIVDALAADLYPPSPSPTSPVVPSTFPTSSSLPTPPTTAATLQATTSAATAARTALLRAAHVAPAWTARAQRHLFRRVALRGAGQCARFAAFVAACPRVGRLVAHLVVRGVRGSSSAFSCGGWDTEDEDGEDGNGDGEDGDEDARLPAPRLAALLAHLPNLRSLQLHELSFCAAPSPLPSLPPLPPLPPPAYTEHQPATASAPGSPSTSPSPSRGPSPTPPPAYSLLPPPCLTYTPSPLLGRDPSPDAPALPRAHAPKDLDELIIMNAGSPRDTTADVLRVLALFGRVRSVHLSGIEQRVEDADEGGDGDDGDGNGDDGESAFEDDFDLSRIDGDNEKATRRTHPALALAITTLKLEDVAADAYLRALRRTPSVRSLRALDVACGAAQDGWALSALLRGVARARTARGGKDERRDGKDEKVQGNVGADEAGGPDEENEEEEGEAPRGIEHLTLDLAPYLQIEYVPDDDAPGGAAVVLPDVPAMLAALAPGLAVAPRLRTLALGAALGPDPGQHGVAWACVAGVLGAAPVGVRRVGLEVAEAWDEDDESDDEEEEDDDDDDDESDAEEKVLGDAPGTPRTPTSPSAADSPAAADPAASAPAFWSPAFSTPSFARVAAACTRFGALERVSVGVAPGCERGLGRGDRAEIERAFGEEGLGGVLCVEAR